MRNTQKKGDYAVAKAIATFTKLGYDGLYHSNGGEHSIYLQTLYKWINLDFYVEDLKVCIEYNGDLWHANPKIYPEGTKLHPHQIKGKSRDKSKEAYITKVDNCAWNYLALWESDIKKNVSKCVDKIE